MTRATKFRDSAHARIYASWRGLPAWQSLSLPARAVLIEIMMEFRPGSNGRLEWSCRKAAAAVHVSKATAARALSELELKGWICVERVSGFARRTTPSCYSLTMFANDLTGDPPSFAFELWRPGEVLPKPIRVASKGRESIVRGTQQLRERDTSTDPTAPIRVSEALKLSKAFNRLPKSG